MLIDISNHQGAINWAAAAPAIDGAYIKVTEGTNYIDPYWPNYHAGLAGGGKPVGAYHFADLGDPVAEANFFADQVLKATWQLRPTLDIETNGATASWITAFRDQFRRRVPDPRFRVYTSMSFLAGALDPVRWIDADTDIWMAHYSTTPGWNHPQLVLWQNTSAAFVPGVVGNVDTDQFMNGWTPAADINGGTDMDAEQDVLLRDIHEQLMGAGNRAPGPYNGWPTFVTAADGGDPNAHLTLVDFVRAIDRAVWLLLNKGLPELSKEVADLAAAFKAGPTPTVDQAVLTKALTDAGLSKVIVTALLAVLVKAAATP